MTSQILTELKQHVAQYTLVPAGGGCFEVEVDGELIYSKLETGSFPNEREILDQLRSLLKS